MKDQFVPYEIAKMLKELGYDEAQNNFYSANGGNEKIQVLYICADGVSDNSNRFRTTAPTWWQVKEWLWEKHKIHIETNEDFYNATRFETFIRDKGFKQVGYFDSPITAEIEGIKKAVEYLHSKLK